MKIRPGDVLISEPFLPDPNFARSVVLVVEHNAEGTVGFVVNHLLGMALSDVVPLQTKNPLLDIPMLSGGPVGTDTLHVLHQLGDHVPGSKYVANHIYWGGDFDQIQLLLLNQNANYKDFRFMVGYSGWAPGQLEQELEQNSWIVLKGKGGLIFETELEDLWQTLLEVKGGKYKLLKNSPNRPDLN
ncbi:MAG: YqgE/AlgH family protein [Bacteroidetes bacterium]|nr:YqgE/AlgH family protein [Bacteroidota bacterium]